MNEATIDTLVALNERFYAAQAKSFSETRRTSWPGWEHCLPYVQNAAQNVASQGALQCRCRLLDVACGNLRFEAFLREQVPQVSFDVCAVDSCAPLAGEFAIAHVDDPGEAAGTVPFDVRFCELDVIGVLRTGCTTRDLVTCSPASRDSVICSLAVHNSTPLFDVAVAFGFMHHVPTAHLRVRLLRELVQSVRPGGYVIVSFWGFLRDDRLREKALLSHERALADLGLAPDDLDEGDFILGWQHERAAYRYCHNFTSRDVDELVREVSDCAQVETRFFADGRTGNLNEYLVLRRIAR
ncbi:methyltransferase domain-containing protein [Adlercreutzia sp. ZJ138]|uniref:methyltransferase domain-containing protein n=1 Tax=Adlercreutzia sp. ZJ138 TaxID=2709405 RepID=UPI0013ECC65F|nr:class I SAM-dependent methyltransferase [Adlercreutzia sp. ZJ138]